MLDEAVKDEASRSPMLDEEIKDEATRPPMLNEAANAGRIGTFVSRYVRHAPLVQLTIC